MKALPAWISRTGVTLLGLDIVLLVLSFNTAHWLRLGESVDGWVTWSMTWPLAFVVLALYVLDTYRPSLQISPARIMARTIAGVVMAGMLVSLFVYITGYWGKDPLFGRGIFAMALVMFLPAAGLMRLSVGRLTRRQSTKLRWLVLGSGERAALFQNDLQAMGMVGDITFVAHDAREKEASLLPVFSRTVDELNATDLVGYTGIVITLDPPLTDELVKKLLQVRFSGTRIYDLSGFYEDIWQRVPVLHTGSGWFVFSDGFELLHNPIGFRIKRILDLALALMLMVLLLPVMLLIAAAIRLDSPGSVIFRQKRHGENGREFTVYKFRTMHDGAQHSGAWTVENDPRITRVGRLTRLVRLDELPQLLNVIRGDMSFIGPRPEATELSALYEREIPFYRLRYSVRPGITGWAQVMYRYGSSVEDAHQKLQYDLYYIKNYSLLLDLVILLKTLRVVLLGRGR